MTLSQAFTLKEIDTVAQEVLKVVDGKIICFSGEMGAGKTTFIKALVKNLGGEDSGNSPTFGLVNQYNHPSGKILGYHFDFYRLNDELEALDIGVEEYFYSGNYCLVEWPEKIPNLLPDRYLQVSLEVQPDQRRTIYVSRHE